MNLDIEKIKAALQLAHSELAYLEAGVPTSVLTFEAVDKTKEAIATLKAYDPDAIRRECLEISMTYIEYVMSMWPERCFIKSELREKLGIKPAAIMSAGKE